MTDADRVFSVAALRELDRRCVEDLRIPSLLLMEHAAMGLVEHAKDLASERGLDRFLVLVGPGQNGGDGLAAARLLHALERDVEILLAADPDRFRGDAAINLAPVLGLGLRASPPGVPLPPPPPEGAVVIDALLGTGLSRAPEGWILDAIRWVEHARASGSVVVSADLPSGMDADTGRFPGAGISADLTVTFAGRKRGFDSPGASDRLGRVEVAPIGAPRWLLDELADGPASSG